MPQQTLVDAANLLKDLFDSGAVKEQLHNVTNCFNWFKTKQLTGREASARNFIWAVEQQRTGGTRWSADAANTSAALPQPERPRVQQARVLPKWIYKRVEASGQTMRLSQSNEGAFASELTYSMKAAVKDITKQLNFTCFGDGSGTVARINDAAIDATVAVAAAGGDYRAEVTDYEYGTRYVSLGSNYAAATAVYGGTVRAGTGIPTAKSADDNATPVLTFDALPAGWADNDFIGLEGSYDAAVAGPDGSNVMQGLQSIVDDDGDGQLVTTVHNINRATAGNEFWRSYVNTNAGVDRALTLGLMGIVYDRVSETGDGTPPKKIVMHKAVRRQYQALLSPDIRFAPLQLRGGFQKLTFAYGDEEIPIETDDDCTYGTIYFLNPDTFRMLVWHPLKWADEDGLTLRQVQDEDSWEAWMVMALQIACFRPNGNGVLRDITFSLTA